MKEYTKKAPIQILAIDLAKASFQLHGVDAAGHKVMGKKLNRQQLKEFMVNLPPCLVAMEACGSAHYWARLFESFGHTARLIAPQFVKPFVKSNKNDAVDAEAIAEAAQRPNMHFVAIKTEAQQDTQALHRIRSQAIKNRTALVNQIRGLLLERDVVLPKGRAHVREKLPWLLEDAENGLSPRFRELLSELQDELIAMDKRIERCDKDLNRLVEESEAAQRLITIPGIGAQTATALLSSIGDVGVFKNGREMAAFLGLVTKQRSTGGKPTLLGISKRGDVYLRSLLIHGARSVLQWVEKKSDPTSQWAYDLMQRRGKNVAAVALANKMARTAFALLRKEQRYVVPTAA